MSEVRALKLDGRVVRTAATHEKILSITRELILTGNIDPTAREIAEATAITTRTLFRHFSDMESLHRSLIEDAGTKAAAVMDEPFPDQTASSWRDQMQIVITRRVRVFESLLPLYISTIWSRYRALTSGSQRDNGISRRRKRLMEVLPREITQDQILFEVIDGVLGIEYWISLRRDQSLSVSKATRVLRLAVERLTAHE
jgi:AcrR family transcriptional regulator